MKTGSMVMNILALVLVFPSVVCSSFCGAAITGEMGSSGSSDAAGVYGIMGILATWGGLLFSIIGSILGFVALKRPRTGIAIAAGAIMIIAGLLNISQIMAANPMGVVVGIFYLIAGGLTLGMKPESSVA